MISFLSLPPFCKLKPGNNMRMIRTNQKNKPILKDYVYEGEKLFGIPENLSVVDSNRQGYEKDTSIVIPREKLLSYFDFVKTKIQKYLENLTVEELFQKPENCEYSRFELILGQIRHQFWHIGLSSAITFESKHIWNEFTGVNGLRSKF